MLGRKLKKRRKKKELEERGEAEKERGNDKRESLINLCFFNREIDTYHAMFGAVLEIPHVFETWHDKVEKAFVLHGEGDQRLARVGKVAVLSLTREKNA